MVIQLALIENGGKALEIFMGNVLLGPGEMGGCKVC
jgi:hypothetical protein